MRKIINGRTYNTETSKIVGECSKSYPRNDFNYCREMLYKNTKGAYFLYGEGGPMSKYARRYGNSTGGGEDITPMTYEEARRWAEECLDPAEYEAEFGESEDAEPESDLVNRERVNLTLNKDMMSKLRRLSKINDTPMARMVDKAILAMYGKEFDKLDR